MANQAVRAIDTPSAKVDVRLHLELYQVGMQSGKGEQIAGRKIRVPKEKCEIKMRDGSEKVG